MSGLIEWFLCKVFIFSLSGRKKTKESSSGNANAGSRTGKGLLRFSVTSGASNEENIEEQQIAHSSVVNWILDATFFCAFHYAITLVFSFLLYFMTWNVSL